MVKCNTANNQGLQNPSAQFAITSASVSETVPYKEKGLRTQAREGHRQWLIPAVWTQHF